DQTKRVIGGTNFNGSTGVGNIITSATNNLTNVGTGLNLGIINGAVTIGGTQILNLGLLASALETNAGANILATPNLLTLDNEEARIIIGQNVPFITGQYATTATTTGTVNPFQTIERKDVGTVLRVRPQVSEAGAVKLTIFQEVSSVSDTSLSAGLITNRRAIESNVLVDDGQMIVLGGLIEDRVEGGEQKVPGLGNLPLIGQLFRYDNRKHTKTNLMVFLRPRVLRDTESSSIATTDRYDYIRQLQADTRLPAHWALPEYQSPVLPPAGGVPSGPSRGVAEPMMVPIPDTRTDPDAYPPGDPRAPVPQPTIPAPTVSPSPPAQQVPPVPSAPGASAPGAAPAGPGTFPVVPPTAASGASGAQADDMIDARASRSAAQAQTQAPAPITRSLPTMIQPAPGEGLVPVDRDPRAQPAGPTISPN
ncbi:MAG: hypothetical protein QM674_14570, partial [Burkholderiaceae bacterium]